MLFVKKGILLSFSAFAGCLAAALGTVGLQFSAAAPASAATCYATSLAPGASGTCVKDLQQMLNGTYAEIQAVNNGGRPYAGGAMLTVNGQYGPQTAAQVKTFQEYAAVAATGNVVMGTGIWDKLCAYAVNGESASQRSGSSSLDSYMRTGVTAGLDAGCPAAESESKFVSLGGSIAAGLGLSPALSARQNGVDVPSSLESECGRSQASFAYITAKAEGLQLIQLACSGATSGEIISGQGTIQGSQLTHTADDVKGNIVSLAFTGANDIHWIVDESTCLQEGCHAITGAYDENGAPVIPIATLNQLTANIVRILQTVHSEGARVIIVDQYYAVTQGAPTCINKNFSASDYAWMTTELNALNAAIEAGVSEASVGARLVKPNFDGHGVCDPVPWVAGPGRSDGAAEHPTAAGQQYLASINEAAIVAG